MLRSLLLCFFVCWFLACAEEPGEAFELSSSRVPAQLLHVIDGDTLIVRLAGKHEKIRLLRIDTPERDEEGFLEASNVLKKLLEDKQLSLEYEGERYDRHGRQLCYLWATPFDRVSAGGEVLSSQSVQPANINLEMVRSGWSRYYTRYGRGKYEKHFELAEEEARQAKRGLWSK